MALVISSFVFLTEIKGKPFIITNTIAVFHCDISDPNRSRFHA